jgi:hypothetical protein
VLKIKSVELAHEVSDLENDFVDVMVDDISCYDYTIVVTTPTSLLKVMNDNSVNFIKPEVLIIVKQSNQQFIKEAINEYALNYDKAVNDVLSNVIGKMRASIKN